MHELHTPEPWSLLESTEDYQGHFVLASGRTVAATITEDVWNVTSEELANACLLVTAPALLKALRHIARDADFREDDGAMELGQRLLGIEQSVRETIAQYEARLEHAGTGDDEPTKWAARRPDFYKVGPWLHEHDLASKLEGWLVTNDSDNNCCIARLDDPSNLSGQPGLPQDFVEPRFASDEEAVAFVRGKAAAGSWWHAEAIAIHDARIPLSKWIYDSGFDERILDHVSAGPWRDGLHMSGFSAESEPCVYGDERELPLVRLEPADEEAMANVVLLAAAWELCQELGLLLDAATDHAPPQPSCELGRRCCHARALLSRIHRDLERSAAERYGKEVSDE